MELVSRDAEERPGTKLRSCCCAVTNYQKRLATLVVADRSAGSVRHPVRRLQCDARK
jgi:hypothetical protein